MRVDYFHTGNAAEEHFSLDRVVLEPLPWPGNPTRPIDDTNLGKYLFEVIDRATNRVVYSRGFASVYGEWETTGEAKDDPPHVLRVAALSRAGGPRPDRRSRSATRRTPSARSGSLLVDPKDVFIDTAAAGLAGPAPRRSRRAESRPTRSTS